MPDPYEKVNEPDYSRGDLFRPVEAGESGAYVGINRNVHALSLYSAGYFEAASRLGSRLMTNGGCIDIEVYPLIYLYRHAVELATKYIHRVLEDVFRTGQRFQATHKITDNWNAMRPNLEMALHEDQFAPRPNLNKLQEILTDLVAVDPVAEAFRFPQTKNGDEPAADLQSINLHAFCNALEYVRAELKQIIEWLDGVHPAPILDRKRGQ